MASKLIIFLLNNLDDGKSMHAILLYKFVWDVPQVTGDPA